MTDARARFTDDESTACAKARSTTGAPSAGVTIVAAVRQPVFLDLTQSY
jgi:hypothetical protein